VRSLGELFLHFFVNFNISLESFNLTLHFVVFKKQLLCLFRLIFKFSRQLMILQNSQTSCGLQLLIIKSEKVSFCFLDFIKHVFSQFLGSLDLFPFLLVDLTINIIIVFINLLQSIFSFFFESDPSVFEILFEFLLFHNKEFHLLFLSLEIL